MNEDTIIFFGVVGIVFLGLGLILTMGKTIEMAFHDPLWIGLFFVELGAGLCGLSLFLWGTLTDKPFL